MELEKIRYYLLAKQYRFIQDIEAAMCADLNLTSLPIDRVLIIFADYFYGRRHMLSEHNYRTASALNKNTKITISSRQVKYHLSSGQKSVVSWNCSEYGFEVANFNEEFTLHELDNTKAKKIYCLLRDLEENQSS